MDSQEGASNTNGQNRRTKNNPLGLRGRELGMYHRDKQRTGKGKKDEPIEHRPIVSMSEKLIADIENKLLEASNSFDEKVSSQFEDAFKDIIHCKFKEFIQKKQTERTEIKEDADLDNKFYDELKEKVDSKKFQTILSKRQKLPVFARKEDLIKAIEENKVILVSGDTGCGKSTQIPQFILDSYINNKQGSKCSIVCTQPRRISAITVSERVAWERCEKLGSSVGYKIRLESVKPREHGSITFVTTGTLLRQLESDPILPKISHIILDEIHERNVETDLLLGLLKEINRYRLDLKIILMSATFCFESFAKYFDNCPIIQIHGTLYPVQEKYLEDILQDLHFTEFIEAKKIKNRKYLREHKGADDEFKGFIEPYARSISNEYSSHVIKSISNPTSEQINIDLIKALIFYIHTNMPAGAILVFLPSYEKICKAYNILRPTKEARSAQYAIYGLHSMMPTTDQKDVFRKPPRGTRKIILATNIAETSITIDDVVYVINSGRSKINEYHIGNNIQTLEEKWITLANCHQRRGRAGRVSAGICYNLYTRAREYTFEKFPIPEIVKSKLESVILNLKMLHINDVQSFLRTMLDPPERKAIENGIALLKMLNALDAEECLTPLGLHLARLPIDPQIGKMILMAATFRCIDPLTSIAASLSYKDAFYRPLGFEAAVDERKCIFAKNCKSDHLMLANVIEDFRNSKDQRKFCNDNFLSHSVLLQLEKMKRQFCELLFDDNFLDSPEPQCKTSNKNSNNQSLLRGIIAAGLYPNIAYLRKSRPIKNRVAVVHSMSTAENGSVKFHPSSTNLKQRQFESKFFVYFMKQKTTDVFLLDSTMIYPIALIIFGSRIDIEDNTISIGSGYKFESDRQSTEVIIKLRKMLNVFLQKKALCPATVEVNSKDSLLLQAIEMLLSKKDKLLRDTDSD